MNLEIMKMVYALDPRATSSNEQAVLVALAFCMNSKTNECYPSQGTLMDMTHIKSKTTITDALNSLRKKGLLDWDKGGRTGKRGKHGMVLSNSYIFNLDELKKRRRKEHGEETSAPAPSSPVPAATAPARTSHGKAGNGRTAGAVPLGKGIDNFMAKMNIAQEPPPEVVRKEQLQNASPVTPPKPFRKDENNKPLISAKETLDMMGFTPKTKEYEENCKLLHNVIFNAYRTDAGYNFANKTILQFKEELDQGKLKGKTKEELFDILMSRLKEKGGAG